MSAQGVIHHPFIIVAVLVKPICETQKWRWRGGVSSPGTIN
jgi:hypothetical protein